MIVPIILCGGFGAHLWPLSRELYPKQVISVMGGNLSLLQQTVARLAEFQGLDSPIVLCNEEHRFMAAAQIQALGVKARSIILESKGRNTAPALAVAAMEAINGGEDPILLVFPVDHFFEKIDPLTQAIHCVNSLTEKGEIVSFGIRPTEPSPGYGYIEKGDEVSLDDADVPPNCRVYRVLSFFANPTPASASAFVESQRHFWNSGILMFKASVFLQELREFAPEILEWCTRAHSMGYRDMDFLRLDSESFNACPSASIDTVLMEKTKRAVIVPLDILWRDLGAWSDLYKVQKKDESGNVLIGDVITHNVRNSYLHANSRMLAAVGIESQVVIETKDAVFVAPFDSVEDVDIIVSRLQASQREEAKVHSKVYRPWGAYECIDLGDRFQVKRITVNPGAKLSLQKHYHRAEHWVVVQGTAKITRDSDEMILTENQSTYVPLGTVHRLENPGVIPLELIEIQTGSYLKEDDIVRFDDVYGRTKEEAQSQERS
jgi:mannose-1-phosphate guanylyltransferase / mannose-6-phosphate isomerase